MSRKRPRSHRICSKRTARSLMSLDPKTIAPVPQMTVLPSDEAAETPFYIPATGPSTRPRRTLKHDDIFAVFDGFGDIGATAGGPDGIYFNDTRFLSRLEMSLNGMQPLLLGSNIRDDNTLLSVDLTNPDIYSENRLLLPKDTIHIVRTVFLWQGTAHQRIALRNHGERAIGVNLSLTFGSDFADLFEVRGMRRARRGRKSEDLAAPDRIIMRYDGLDGRTRQTLLAFDPAPTQLTESSASYRLVLPPAASTCVFLAVACDQTTSQPASFYKGLLAANRGLKRSTAGVATVTTSNDLFNEVLFRLYYGSVDSTPLFVMLAGLYAERTGDWEFVQELWPAIEWALAWIDGPGDPDRDGFVEYHRASKEGLVNQGWKDSVDAIFHADGSLAQGPIALAEVQAYVYAAKCLASRCARRLGRDDHAVRLEAQASDLARRFEEAFWCPDLDTYALALDGKKRACRVRTSNAGQVLFTGIASADRACKVGRGLLRPQFFSRWGIRTVSSEERRYNPMSSHNGSVWPHDNALIALGLAKYGLKYELERLFRGLFDAATYMDLRRLPELFCGFQRRRGRGPTLYPVACAPQAWASGTPFTLIQAALGLEFDTDASEIRLRNPRLPAFLDDVIVRNLRLGATSVDLALRRHNEDVGVQVLRKEGSIRVSAVYT